jgi:hypothetical protein
VTSSERLAEVAGALEDAGLDSLVLGGHAVRYYGIDRNTVDYDFCTSAPSIKELRDRLRNVDLFRELREGPSWRPNDFARFEIGRLPDGREEWLEFWLHNHLLPDFFTLRDRQERGMYGGRTVKFISLADLIRSKETERESDWQDIALLEEVQDARLLASANTQLAIQTCLSNIRSRRGFDRVMQAGLLDDSASVAGAIQQIGHPVTFAYLRPLVKDASLALQMRGELDAAFLQPLQEVEVGSHRHFALVEIVRRAYKRWAMMKDRQDKQSKLRP